MVSILSQLKSLWNSEKNIFEKENITILVTDSGVGGISIANDLYYFFDENNYYRNVNIVYANCRNGKNGYNAIEDVNMKIKMFSDKLFELDKILNPDIIFIACNTLSVLLNKTQFYANNTKPIIDICDISLKLMSDSLKRYDGLFVLGTKTTIGENYYKNNLIDMGFDKNNIINQLCPNLAKYIQHSHGYGYINMVQNVRWLTNRIKEKKPKHFQKYAVSFNCTHYFYAMKYFRKYFTQIDEEPIFICPNFELKNSFVKYLCIDKFVKTNVKLYIYKPNITQKQKHKILFFSENKNLYFLD